MLDHPSPLLAIPLLPARPPDLSILPKTFHSHYPSSLVLVAAAQEAKAHYERDAKVSNSSDREFTSLNRTKGPPY